MMTLMTGIEYLKADIACNYDNNLDKKDWIDRISWCDKNEPDLEKLIDSAEDPALYYASVQAYRCAQRGEPSGYPISLDACASGLQILSVLMGCEKSGSLCGIVPNGHRADAYQTLYSHICEEAKNKKLTHTTPSKADVKQAIMTAFYSSTRVPKQIFGEGELLEVFFDVMKTQAPGAWKLNEGLTSLWQSDALSHDWVLPDNFHAHCKVIGNETHTIHFMNRPSEVTLKVNTPTPTGKSLGPNIIHSIDGMIVREMHRRCQFDIDKIISIIDCLDYNGTDVISEDSKMVMLLWNHYIDSGFLSARILDHLNRDNMGLVDSVKIAELIKSMPETPFQIMSIHDCFRVLPNYGNDVRNQYNTIMSEIAGSKMLEFIASQILGHPAPVSKLGNIVEIVKTADYALS